MSVNLERKNRFVELETFTTDDILTHLSLRLNVIDPHLRITGRPKFCNGVMAKFDNTSFIIHAEETSIELSFDKDEAFILKPVIREIMNWDKFSKTEQTFYVTIDEDNSRTIIFENGYASCEDYRRFFNGEEISITIF